MLSPTTTGNDMDSLHQVMQLLQTLDNGLVLLDADYNVQMWNSFMENHSGIAISDARGKNLFDLFPDLPKTWLRRKIDSAFSLQSRAFCTWEEHPRLFNFKSTRPLTGRSAMMYQNITLIPLTGLNGAINSVCLLVYDVTEIATRKQDLESANKTLQKISRTDKLTGLYNRGYWEECLEQEFKRCQRSKRPSALILFDIDHFKTFNDTHGHTAGDEVLRAVARAIKETQRSTDISGRYGGEEFGLVLPETTQSQAMLVAERLRETIAAATVEWDSTTLQVTVSIGVAEYSDSLKDHQNWLEVSDKALYRAKEDGRNCTKVPE
ncbi:diguanylate cyclase [Pseudohongiella acticola]|jgi:diguanylate cyclase|uniref:diguanylate cyclase n=1 Tax=Pseudohongiella acticola TaxID=1524254 RepID=A0A1E8CI77_9GAMM|nr:diguanylate cyclase [Pseudohongiella acticola]OFE12079.1 diguanylate cyclase [Pseudohongiella acticola]